MTIRALFLAASMAAFLNTSAQADAVTPPSKAELERLDKVDPPIKEDPVGNAIIGGVATGSIKGAVAGAISAARGALVGGAIQQGKEKVKEAISDRDRDGARSSGGDRSNRGGDRPGEYKGRDIDSIERARDTA